MTELVLRMNILGGMNEFVLNHVNDEHLVEWWFIWGIPDGANEEDLKEIAMDNDTFSDVCKIYSKIILSANDTAVLNDLNEEG